MLPAQATSLAATMTVADAVIAAYNGFPESDTQVMWLGGWMKERYRSSSYPSNLFKGSYQQRGVTVSVTPSRIAYLGLNKAGVAGSNSSISKRILFTWKNIIIKIYRDGTVEMYENGVKVNKTTIAGFSNGEHWTDGTYGPMSLQAQNNSNIAINNVIFCSTNNAADINKITDEEILRFVRTGIAPAKAIHWPMNEGTGTVCKAYVDGVNVPALNGTLSVNSWTTDDNFGRI